MEAKVAKGDVEVQQFDGSQSIRSWVTALLRQMQPGDRIEIENCDVGKVRSYISNFGMSNGMKFRTESLRRGRVRNGIFIARDV